MSAVDGTALSNETGGVELRACELDVVELTALRGKAGELEALARQRGVSLPTMGRVAIASDRISLCVRPGRWLLLTAAPETAAVLRGSRGAGGASLTGRVFGNGRKTGPSGPWQKASMLFGIPHTLPVSESPPNFSAALMASLGVVTDLSSSLTALHLAGAATREVLVRGCRLDLDPEVFQRGHAAATIMAQVSVILARLDTGMLLLTPATTGQHFREWLMSAGQPFGLVPRESVSVTELCEERLR